MAEESPNFQAASVTVPVVADDRALRETIEALDRRLTELADGFGARLVKAIESDAVRTAVDALADRLADRIARAVETNVGQHQSDGKGIESRDGVSLHDVMLSREVEEHLAQIREDVSVIRTEVEERRGGS